MPKIVPPPSNNSWTRSWLICFNRVNSPYHNSRDIYLTIVCTFHCCTLFPLKLICFIYPEAAIFKRHGSFHAHIHKDQVVIVPWSHRLMFRSLLTRYLSREVIIYTPIYFSKFNSMFICYLQASNHSSAHVDPHDRHNIIYQHVFCQSYEQRK